MAFPLLGEIASLAAACCWAVGLTLYRCDVRAIGAPQVNLFKGLIGTTLTVSALLVLGTGTIGARAQVMLMLSGIVGICIGDTLLFHALGRIGTHRTALLQSVGPVLTAMGGWLLGETLLPRRILGIACTMAGVALVVYFRRKDDSGARPPLSGVVYGVLAAACQAGGVLLAKQGMSEADPLAASALRLVASTAVLALVGLLRGSLGPDLRRLVRPGPLMRLVPAAFIGTFLALWLMQVGIAFTKSAVANALHSTTPLFTLPIAIFFLRERLGLGTVAGSLLAVGGVVVLLLS
jgi:drug/metabolite transporter (DMT)-like permease